MTAFTFNASISKAARGIDQCLIAVTDGDLATADQFTAGETFSLGYGTQGPIRKFILSDTSEAGPATGTIVAADTILADNGGSADTVAGAGNVGAIAVGVGLNDATQFEMLVEIKAALEHPNAFGPDFFDVSSMPGSAADGGQFLTLEVEGRVAFGEDFSEIGEIGIVHTPADQTKMNRVFWENYSNKLDDDTAMSTVLQERMGTADANASGGFDIASTSEYEDKFLPTLFAFKKKVK
tara:strand:- start:10780 stop:11493 length:714 start_codon:yes stop_codon:yes gene_type:complete